MLATGLVAIGVVLGLALSLDKDTSATTRFVLLAGVCAALVSYAGTRIASIRNVKVLIDRIGWLESQLGLVQPEPIARFQRSSLITLIGSAVLLVLTIYILLANSFTDHGRDVLERRDEMIRYAYKFRGVPYQWGGDSLSTGVDCSGFTRQVLQEFELLPDGDYSAQGLFNHYSDFVTKGMKPGNLIFFGKNDTSISHVGMIVDHTRMIEVAVGDSRTRTLASALTRDAKVCISMIGRRADCIAVADPFAPAGGEEYWHEVAASDSAWSDQIQSFPNAVIGDVDSSEEIDLNDILQMVRHVFSDAEQPHPAICGDVNCTGDIDASDVFYLIEYVFSGRDAPCDMSSIWHSD